MAERLNLEAEFKLDKRQAMSDLEAVRVSVGRMVDAILLTTGEIRKDLIPVAVVGLYELLEQFPHMMRAVQIAELGANVQENIAGRKVNEDGPNFFDGVEM